MEGANRVSKNSFSLLLSVYDLRCQCHKIYNVMKKDSVLDWRDGRVADASGFNCEFCAGDRVRFSHQSNLILIANGPPLLRC